MTSNKLADWKIPGFSPIITLDKARDLVNSLKKHHHLIGLTSGGFDPIHPGHISSIKQSKWAIRRYHLNTHGCHPSIVTFVVVNSDRFLENKKKVKFQCQKVRCQIVAGISDVDWVIAYQPTNPDDMTACEAIEVLQPHYFTKGGDRGQGNVPEEDVCREVGTKILYGVGEEKAWSSSDFLKEYRENYAKHIGQEAIEEWLEWYKKQNTLTSS